MCEGQRQTRGMTALPPLQNLHLGHATGVPIQLFERKESKGARDAKKIQKVEETDPTATTPVDDFTTPEKAKIRLDELLFKLLGNYPYNADRYAEKVVASKAFVDKWRYSICENMNSKRMAYNTEALLLRDEIKTEHAKQNRIFEAAQRGLNEVGSDPKTMTRVERDAEREATALLRKSKTDEKWDIIKDNLERWRALNSQVEEITKLQDQIEVRVKAIVDDETWKGLVARFANTVKQMYDYPQLSDLTEKIVDNINAFVSNPSISSNQFFNIMIMGVAGTGKTRLAGIIGSIFSQLGMYVYETLVEASAGDFIGQYLGETAAKSKGFLTRNLERVVFLDEAYALTRWNEEHTRLESYSEEAVEVLIPFLSENVGKMAFIVAGYEDMMKSDFLPSNQGMGRRFPIRGTLTNYPKEALFKIFLRQVALNLVGKKPANAADLVGWEKTLNDTIATVTAMFDGGAQMLFNDVVDASEETETLPTLNGTSQKSENKEMKVSLVEMLNDVHNRPAARADADPEGEVTQLFDIMVLKKAMRLLTCGHEKKEEISKESFSFPYLNKLFAAQAGAMANMAGVASSLILATEKQVSSALVADRRAMFNIILTYMQSVFTGSEGDVSVSTLAREDLVKALRAKKWIDQGDDGDVWKSAQRTQQDLNDTTTIRTDKFYKASDILLKSRGGPFAFQMAEIWKPPPVEAPTPKKTATNGGKPAALKITEQTLSQTLGGKDFHEIFKYTDKDGKQKRGSGPGAVEDIKGDLKIRVPTNVIDGRKAPSVWMFDAMTKDGNFSNEDENVVNNWLDNEKIRDPNIKRQVMESAKDLKYQWYARKDIEAAIYKLLKKKLQSAQTALAKQTEELSTIPQELSTVPEAQAGSSRQAMDVDGPPVTRSKRQNPSNS